jgi:hypothetical protein
MLSLVLCLPLVDMKTSRPEYSTLCEKHDTLAKRTRRYSILAVTAALLILSCMIVGHSRPFHEVVVSVWSAAFLGGLSIVGTMIMRKFHNSMAVGFFMGVTVGCSQWFVILSLVYTSYAREQRLMDAEDNVYGNNGTPSIQSGKEETLLAIVAAVQAILLGSFAAILAAHRSEILDKQAAGGTTGTSSTPMSGGGGTAASGGAADDADDSSASYDPPPASSGPTNVRA